VYVVYIIQKKWEGTRGSIETKDAFYVLLHKGDTLRNVGTESKRFIKSFLLLLLVLSPQSNE